MMLTRRSILRGLIAAPIICAPGVLMPVKRLIEPDHMILPEALIWYGDSFYQRYSGYDMLNIKPGDVLRVSEFAIQIKPLA